MRLLGSQSILGLSMRNGDWTHPRKSSVKLIVMNAYCEVLSGTPRRPSDDCSARFRSKKPLAAVLQTILYNQAHILHPGEHMRNPTSRVHSADWIAKSYTKPRVSLITLYIAICTLITLKNKRIRVYTIWSTMRCSVSNFLFSVVLVSGYMYNVGHVPWCSNISTKTRWYLDKNAMIGTHGFAWVSYELFGNMGLFISSNVNFPVWWLHYLDSKNWYDWAIFWDWKFQSLWKNLERRTKLEYYW